ncbi:metallophosphoesterase [bacterium]|nr:metallophosphoesterase [bacterium]
MNDILDKSSWRNAIIPKNTIFFCIGDIHGEHILLETLLDFISKKINGSFRDLQVKVIFIGDYIDRGLNSKKTIEKLIEYEHSFKKNKKVDVHFLCGNHDEFFNKLMGCSGICLDPINNSEFDNDPIKKLILSPANQIYFKGFKAWFNIGGGKSTIIDYCPEIYDQINSLINEELKNTHTHVKIITSLIQKLKNSVPFHHKEFFSNVVENIYVILGDYLFIHAGINPNISLQEQGITIKHNLTKKRLSEHMNLRLMMLRDVFLWRDNLENCKYYVIHGHTPSEIKKLNTIVADGQKNYRLCVDSKVYDINGSLTCFFKSNDSYQFFSIPKSKPNKILKYKI